MKKWKDKTIVELEKEKWLFKTMAVMNLIFGAILLILSMYIYDKTRLIVLPLFGLIMGCMSMYLAMENGDSLKWNDILIYLKKIEGKL